MPDAHQVDPHAAAIAARYATAAVASTGCDPDACDGQAVSFGAAQYAAGEFGDGTVPSLGCGNPLRVAELRTGDTVLDLGSDAGLDLLLSSRRVGPAGRVIGLDMTPEMGHLERRATAAAGDVEVRLGRVEQIPLPDASVDVVISNCVVNLSADKGAVLREVARVLRPGGRIGISDLLATPDADPDQLAAPAAAIGAGVTPTHGGDLPGPAHRDRPPRRRSVRIRACSVGIHGLGSGDSSRDLHDAATACAGA